MRKEAEIEAELVRQIAAEEERERQEAEAAERERVAEAIRKLEEEEHQRWEAEHCVEAVRQVQASESPMQVDDGSGDDRDVEEETEKKGKGKEKNRWEIVRRNRRCKACQKEETACKINLGEIEKWRKSTEKGKVYKEAPPATSCQRCMEVRRKPCILLAMEECQRRMEKLGKSMKPSVAPSTSSGGKRPLEDADRGLLPKKKQKKAEEKMLTEEEFRMEIADTLGLIAVDAARFTRAAELQNFLLQRLVVALDGKGDGTAYGTLPSEGKLLMEDEAEESYKPDESEEGSDE